ncbi:MAG: DUF5683 domain-containing protein [Chitinophagaceae bacterium]
MSWRSILVIIVFTITSGHSYAQLQTVDSTKLKRASTIDSSKKIKPKVPYCDTCFSPKKATIRSAIIPGWGQIYNKQLWKVPLVYGVLGAVAGIFIVNIHEYKGLRDAYRYKVDNDPANDTLIASRYSVLSANSMKFYRDQYRKNVDMSVLAFLIGWALNVVDATVSGHLKQFDVSDDLSMKIKPNFQMNGQTGVSLVFSLKNKKGKLIDMGKILNAK